MPSVWHSGFPETCERGHKTVKHFSSDFFTCGVVGWCMEIIFTGLKNFSSSDRKLMGSTSVWMFPIYGMASFLSPVCRRLKNQSIFKRGGIYTLCIFACEYTAGFFLRKINACPWDYSKARYNIQGLVRPDYAPLWFGAGLLFEKIVTEYPENGHS